MTFDLSHDPCFSVDVLRCCELSLPIQKDFFVFVGSKPRVSHEREPLTLSLVCLVQCHAFLSLVYMSHTFFS